LQGEEEQKDRQRGASRDRGAKGEMLGVTRSAGKKDKVAIGIKGSTGGLKKKQETRKLGMEKKVGATRVVTQGVEKKTKAVKPKPGEHLGKHYGLENGADNRGGLNQKRGRTKEMTMRNIPLVIEY